MVVMSCWASNHSQPPSRLSARLSAPNPTQGRSWRSRHKQSQKHNQGPLLHLASSARHLSWVREEGRRVGEGAGSERADPSQTQEDGSLKEKEGSLKEGSSRALGGSHENSSRLTLEEGSSWETSRSTESAPSPAVPPCSLPQALWRWLLSAPGGTVRAGATEHRVEAAGEKSEESEHAMWLRAMLESDGEQPQRHAAWLQEQSELARKVADTEDSAAHTNRPPRAQPPRAPVRTPHPTAPDASSTQACRQSMRP